MRTTENASFFWKSWIRCWHLISVSFWWTKDDDKTILKWVWLKQRYDNTNTWEFCLWWEMNLIWMWLYFLTLRLSEEKYANFDQVDHVSPLVCTDRVNEGIWLRDEQKRFHLLERQWMMKYYVPTQSKSQYQDPLCHLNKNIRILDVLLFSPHPPLCVVSVVVVVLGQLMDNMQWQAGHSSTSLGLLHWLAGQVWRVTWDTLGYCSPTMVIFSYCFIHTSHALKLNIFY